MNEEQAILDFFAQTENLTLALSVAEQTDKLREQMNNRLWRELQTRLSRVNRERELAWRVELTEDKNAPDNLVGLHCRVLTEQALYLRPMMEQQYLGSEWRIYFGLMWSNAPAPNQLGLADVSRLKASLQKAGLKSNESFLGWQWTACHPRRKDFLLGYSYQPEKTIDSVVNRFEKLLIDHGGAIHQANQTLNATLSGKLSASLNELRKELTG